MRTLSAPKIMNWCRPPEAGPEKPSLRNFRISSRLVIELAIPSGGLNRQTNTAHSWDGVSVANLKYEPFLEDFLKYVTALR